VYDFLLVIIELFSLALTIETSQAEICQRERFLKGWVTSIAHFRSKGCRLPNTVGWHKSRMIALSYGIKILPAGSLD